MCSLSAQVCPFIFQLAKLELWFLELAAFFMEVTAAAERQERPRVGLHQIQEAAVQRSSK